MNGNHRASSAGTTPSRRACLPDRASRIDRRVFPVRLSLNAEELEDRGFHFLRQWGKRGDEPGEFNVPIALVITPDQEVLVSDFRNARVQRFTREGKLLAVHEVGPNPSGLAVRPTGELYVSHFGFDGHPDRITVHDREGKFLREWGRSGRGTASSTCPAGLPSAQTGTSTWPIRPTAASRSSTRTASSSSSGASTVPAPASSAATRGSRIVPGGPHYLAFDSRGDVYYDRRGRLVGFRSSTPEGKFLRAWGDNVDKPGSSGADRRICRGRSGCASTRRIGSGSGRRVTGCSSSRATARTSAASARRARVGAEFSTPHGLALDRDGQLVRCRYSELPHPGLCRLIVLRIRSLLVPGPAGRRGGAGCIRQVGEVGNMQVRSRRSAFRPRRSIGARRRGCRWSGAFARPARWAAGEHHRLDPVEEEGEMGGGPGLLGPELGRLDRPARPRNARPRSRSRRRRSIRGARPAGRPRSRRSSAWAAGPPSGPRPCRPRSRMPPQAASNSSGSTEPSSIAFQTASPPRHRTDADAGLAALPLLGQRLHGLQRVEAVGVGRAVGEADDLRMRAPRSTSAGG